MCLTIFSVLLFLRHSRTIESCLRYWPTTFDHTYSTSVKSIFCTPIYLSADVSWLSNRMTTGEVILLQSGISEALNGLKRWHVTFRDILALLSSEELFNPVWLYHHKSLTVLFVCLKMYMALACFSIIDC